MSGRCFCSFCRVPGEVAFGLAGETAVFPRLRLEFRLPAAVRRESGLLVRDLRENGVGLPDLRRAGVKGPLEGQRLLGQLAGLGQPTRLGLQQVGEVVQVEGPALSDFRCFRSASIALRYQLSAASGLPASWLTTANWFQVCSRAGEVAVVSSWIRAASR